MAPTGEMLLLYNHMCLMWIKWEFMFLKSHLIPFYQDLNGAENPITMFPIWLLTINI